MKIFFIGPYQDISMEGFISRKIIENILNVDSVDLTTHPINLTDKIDRNIEIQRSNNNYIDCDILIQHAPIDMLVGNCMIRKSIIIPICNQPNIKNLDMLKYKKFDQILVNNKYSLDFFKKSFGNKTILYKFSALSNNTKKTFNSKFLSNSTKFYFIGNYRANKYLVKKIILSFMIAFRCNPETSLMFFLDDQPKELEEINDHINHYSKQINLNINHKPIVITPIDISEETLNVIHNTGDIYLSPTTSASNIHCDLAQAYKKKIIYIDRLENISIPTENDYSVGDTELSVTTESLVDSMISIINDKLHYINNESKYIKNIILKL